MKGVLLVGLLTLVSCMGGSGGGSGSGSNNVYRVESTISDSTLVSFTQTSGVAKTPMRWMDLIIARAYAATGNISCMNGQDVSFDMDIQLGPDTENIQVDAKCGDDIELKVRQGMLQALNNHILVREKGQSPTGVGYWLDFTGVEGFQFGVPYTILEKTGWTRQSDGALISNAYWLDISNCYLDYTFNYANGTVSNNALATTYANRAKVKNETTNTNHLIANPNTPNDANGYEGCNSSGTDFGSSDFRFKDGKIEIDESGTKQFSINGCAKWDEDTGALLDYKENGDGNNNCPDAGYDSTFERFCIDDDGNGACDAI